MGKREKRKKRNVLLCWIRNCVSKAGELGERVDGIQLDTTRLESGGDVLKRNRIRLTPIFLGFISFKVGPLLFTWSHFYIFLKFIHLF